MSVAAEITEHYPELNEAQREVVAHLEGPLLVIAGPGSGKTHSIVLRALNLLLLKKTEPKQLVLCTFTNKAAFELRDRLIAAARKVGYEDDLSELRISTIHSFCNRVLTRHRHRTDLGHNYETLDELTQLLFIFENFEEIIGPKDNLPYLSRWNTRWQAIENVRGYFDKIAEELIEVRKLLDSDTPFLNEIGKAYQRYERTLRRRNRVDFSHLQRTVYDLLQDPPISKEVIDEIRYVLVDEYQDTNYIQEQLLLKLTEKSRNLCVVGDEDQSLYRFRGATVRNILEFETRMPDCGVIKLTINYRSHKNIVQRYDRWMASANWANSNGASFRYDKTIEADANATHPDYPSVIAIWGEDKPDEAGRFADFVEFLKTHDVIEDYSQVALLLHSVREKHSEPYLAALKSKGIPAFCPRARAYFEVPEIRYIVACFAIIFNWHGEGRGEVSSALSKLASYVDAAIVELAHSFSGPHPLARALQKWTAEIAGLQEGESLDTRPADYLYGMLALEPFKNAVHDENIARNLAVFSQLLNVFQNYYHYTVITHRNREFLQRYFFNSFLRFLYLDGINEYEDPDSPFPKGHVQVMTIHQVKGLEFPVVVVGSLNAQLPSPKQIDRDLSSFYNRPPFEPESRITNFDRMRLHYVAFSRAQNLLALTAHAEPKRHFMPILESLRQWPYLEREKLSEQEFGFRKRTLVKKTYSFTGDLRIYETCPRQYQFFREYDFMPSRSAVIFFGLLVHQTIEEIHRIALDGGLDTLDEERIQEIFDRTFQFLLSSDVRPIGEAARKAAFRQVMNYFEQNQDEMHRIVMTEVDVSLEKDDYILSGKVDLLMGSDNKLELLDFKTSPRPEGTPELIDAYKRQLCTYAHIMEHRHNRRVERLMLYWTSEPRKEDALMVIPYEKSSIEEAGKHFDQTVRRIQNQDFAVVTPPEPKICKECDLRSLCRSEGIIPAAN